MLTSNHEVVLGDQARKIEVDADGNITNKFEKEFTIGGRDSGESAMIFVCVKGLVGDAVPVTMDINGKSVGQLMPNANASPDSWFTQMLHFSASEGSLNPNTKSNETTNTISIPGKDSKPTAGRFYVQNIVILYKAVVG